MHTRFSRLACLVGLSLPFFAAAAVADDKSLPAPIELGGDWQLLPGHAADDVATRPDSFTGWETTRVPGVWSNGRLDCAWELKRFQVPTEAKGLDCEILFERVQWNAQVWLNGKRLGGSPDGYAPFRVVAGDALRAGGENVLVVRVGGYGEVPKSKSGKTLFPAGFSMHGRGGGGGIMGRVFVRFFNRARLTRLQVMPDLAKSTANVLVRVEGAAPEATVTLDVSESGVGPGKGIGRMVGTASATIKLTDGVGTATVAVPIKDVKPWEPAKPFLYRLVATVTVGGKCADRVVDRFGMREVTCKPDGFYLNGRKVRLLGTNIIGDMGYWRGAPNLVGRDKIKAAIIEPARKMNAVCIRTHTSPIPKWWLDVCDEEGLLVLLEFAVTVNCANLRFDEREFAEFSKNLQNEAAAVVPYLANHPSIAMWVMTNESNNWHEWERTALWKHFKRLDPSRPAIRAAYERLAVEMADFYAWRAMEQTEAARRLGFVLILPFGPGFYGVFGPNPRPVDYALPCALAPVGVSIDLANQHFVAGKKYKADVWVMNDTDAKVATKVHFFLFDTDPGWNPASLPPKAVSREAFDVAVAPHKATTRAFEWTAPAKEGKYFLVARIEPQDGKPVISRRVVYAIRSEPRPKALTGKKVLVIEDPSSKLSAWIAKQGCHLVEPPRPSDPPPARRQLPRALSEAQLVVLGDEADSQPEFTALIGHLPRYVAGGGRVLVLEQFDWPDRLKDLFGIAIERTDYDYDDNNAPADQRTDSVMVNVSQEQASGGSSRVFRWEQPGRVIWKGISDEYLSRWNGRHGRVARVSMSALPGRARVLVKYGEAERDDLKYVPVAAVGHLRGEVLYFMLEIAGRYDSRNPNYDPVVERLMLNLLNY